MILHALLHMAEHDGPVTSDQISGWLGTNPVVVRRTMGFLRNAGIVSSVRGPSGGWEITADLNSVTLRDLHLALGKPTLFAIGLRSDAPECLVEQAVNAALSDTFEEAEALVLDRLQAVSLATLAQDFSRRHAAHRPNQKE